MDGGTPEAANGSMPDRLRAMFDRERLRFEAEGSPRALADFLRMVSSWQASRTGGDMKIGGEFRSSEWSVLRQRLEANEPKAWQEAIQLLEDRVAGRYLAHARQLLDRPYSGFAVLAIDCAVIEALEQFRRGAAKTP